jgi:hypothetical protein
MNPYSSPLKHCIQYTFSHREEGEVGELTREKVWEAIVHKSWSKITT